MYKTLNLSSDIKLIVSDFDGIFTDNSVYILNETSRLKKLSYKDLMGVSIAVKNGINVAIISGEQSKEIDYVAGKFNLEDIHQGIRIKCPILDDLKKKYNLKDIEFKINKNEELFKKFAFIIENNNMLLGYKKEVYDLFEIVVDNKKYLDEFYFLHKLGYLNILDAEELENGKASGTYEDYATRINLVSDRNSVLYHELIHFVDFSFNNKTGTTLYKCGDKIDVYDAVPNIPDGCDYISVIFTNYITEAGAEALTVKYFTKRINAYNFGTYYLEALEYIYGTDEVNKWYFDDDNYFIKVL